MQLFSPSTLKLLDAEVVRIERDGAASRAEANQKQSISGLHEDAQARSALAAVRAKLTALSLPLLGRKLQLTSYVG